MRVWPNALRFLWEEELSSSPPVVSSYPRREATGVPQVMLKAGRWVVIATVGATLMSQIVGLRLVARVDADPTHCPNNGIQTGPVGNLNCGNGNGTTSNNP